MRASTLIVARTSLVLLVLVPATQALPSWLTGIRRRQDSSDPAYYPGYDGPDNYGGYDYGGETSPTLTSSSTPSVTSDSDPVTASSSISTSKSQFFRNSAFLIPF